VVPIVQAEVVAIIPTLSRSRNLDRCIGALLSESDDQDLRILVVGNGGDTGSHPSLDERVTYVSVGVNLGWAGGLRFGRQRIDAQFIWAIQDDMTILPGCLRGLVSVLKSDVGLGAVRPAIVDDRGRLARRSCGGYVDDRGTVMRGWPMRGRRLHGLRVPTDLSYIASSGMLIRAGAWDDVGGWDGRYYPVQYADVDFCARLSANGWRFSIVPGALARHAGSASSPSNLRNLLSFHNRRRFSEVWLGGSAPANWLDQAPAIHPDVSKEMLAELLALSNAALFDLDSWLATQHVIRPFSQRIRGAYWTARAFADPTL